MLPKTGCKVRTPAACFCKLFCSLVAFYFSPSLFSSPRSALPSAWQRALRGCRLEEDVGSLPPAALACRGVERCSMTCVQQRCASSMETKLITVQYSKNMLKLSRLGCCTPNLLQSMDTPISTYNALLTFLWASPTGIIRCDI